MAGPPELQTSPNATSPQQRTSNELVRLVRKLRWMGMEQEAEVLLEELTRRQDMDTVITPSPRETD